MSPDARIVRIANPRRAVELIRADGRRVVAFLGFSAGGYADEDAVRALLERSLEAMAPERDEVCAGATAAGIGMVYPLARAKGFRTLGIVSSLSLVEGAAFAPEVDVIYIIDDRSWGGRTGDGGALSPTSRAVVDASDEIIAIGGGTIASAEASEARALGKPVRNFAADKRASGSRHGADPDRRQD